MVIKKPYAFLIKNFKKIHLFLAAIIILLMFQTNTVNIFLQDYANSGYFSTISVTAGSIFNVFIFIGSFLVLLTSIFVFILMKLKKKPSRIYLFNIIGYALFLVISIIVYNSLVSLEINTMEIRTVRIIRDIFYVGSFINYPALLFALIRGFGFDIKKFNFGADIDELQINVEDSEEFEVKVNIDPDKIKMKARKTTREFGYFLKENKVILTYIGVFTCSIILFSVFMTNYVYQRVYKENESFNVSNIILTVKNTYLTTKDYKGNDISYNDYGYVIVRVNMQNNNAYDTYFEQSYFKLVIGNNIYDHNPLQQTDFQDLGERYYNNALGSGKNKDYIFIFQVDKNDLNRKMYLRYRESVKITAKSLDATYRKINLSGKNIESSIDNGVFNVGDTINFKDTVLGNTTIKINEFSIGDSYNYSYRYCVTETYCNTITDSITTNPYASLDKTLIALDLDFVKDSSLNLSTIKNKYDFIDKYSVLYYTIDGKRYTHNSSLENRTPLFNYNGNTIYIEVLEDIKEASLIELVFTIRGVKYTYILR